MPKIIENLESRLIEEARRQIEAVGYRGVTIRSVASACGVGIGTFYNYFSSKNDLVATYLLEDWSSCMASVDQVCQQATEPEPVVRCMFDQLISYAARHQNVFRDEVAAADFSGAQSPYHALLRQQLAAPMRKFCEDDFAAEFIAEAMLLWTMEGKPFQQIYGMIKKIF